MNDLRKSIDAAFERDRLALQHRLQRSTVNSSLPTNKSDRDYIANIVARVIEAVPTILMSTTRLQLTMDVEYVHRNLYKLDLERMEKWREVSHLVHDVSGIHRFLNRTTGELEESFTPRFTIKEV